MLILLYYLPFTPISTLSASINHSLHPPSISIWAFPPFFFIEFSYPPLFSPLSSMPQLLCLSFDVYYQIIGIAQYSHGLWAGWPGCDSQQGQIFSLLHSVQTGSGAQPASYPVGTGSYFLGCEADHLPPCSAKVNVWAIPSLLPICFMAWYLID
jgi:hypothetical protein